MRAIASSCVSCGSSARRFAFTGPPGPPEISPLLATNRKERRPTTASSLPEQPRGDPSTRTFTLGGEMRAHCRACSAPGSSAFPKELFYRGACSAMMHITLSSAILMEPSVMTEDPDKIPANPGRREREKRGGSGLSLSAAAAGQSARAHLRRTGGGKTVSLQKLAEGFSKAGTAVFLADVKATSPDCHSRATPSRPSSPGQGSWLDLWSGSFSGRFLGYLRRTGPSRARHHRRNGAVAAVPHARPQRHAGRRAQHRVPGRRRAGPSSPRSERPARRPRLRLRQRLGHSKQIWQCRPSHDCAIQRQLLVLENQGGDKFIGEPALDSRTSSRRRRTGAAISTSSPPTSSCRRRAFTRPSCSGC